MKVVIANVSADDGTVGASLSHQNFFSFGSKPHPSIKITGWVEDQAMNHAMSLLMDEVNKDPSQPNAYAVPAISNGYRYWDEPNNTYVAVPEYDFHFNPHGYLDKEETKLDLTVSERIFITVNVNCNHWIVAFAFAKEKRLMSAVQNHNTE